MWQAQRFEGDRQDQVLAEMLAWLNEHEDLIAEFQTVQVHEPDGTQVYVVTYRATRALGYHPFLT